MAAKEASATTPEQGEDIELNGSRKRKHACLEVASLDRQKRVSTQ